MLGANNILVNQMDELVGIPRYAINKHINGVALSNMRDTALGE